MRFYWDGVESVTGAKTTISDDWPVGKINSYWNGQWTCDGRYDEIAIWGTTSGTAANATDLWNSGNGKNATDVIPNPTAYWTFNELNGSVIDDQSGNGKI